MSEKVLIESLSMDLLRVALGLYRGSLKMAERFSQEAIARYNDLSVYSSHNPKLKRLLESMKSSIDSEKKDKHEDLLMYSVLFRNFAIHRSNS